MFAECRKMRHPSAVFQAGTQDFCLAGLIFTTILCSPESRMDHDSGCKLERSFDLCSFVSLSFQTAGSKLSFIQK